MRPHRTVTSSLDSLPQKSSFKPFHFLKLISSPLFRRWRCIYLILRIVRINLLTSHALSFWFLSLSCRNPTIFRPFKRTLYSDSLHTLVSSFSTSASASLSSSSLSLSSSVVSSSLRNLKRPLTLFAFWPSFSNFYQIAEFWLSNYRSWFFSCLLSPVLTESEIL